MLPRFVGPQLRSFTLPISLLAPDTGGIALPADVKLLPSLLPDP